MSEETRPDPYLTALTRIQRRESSTKSLMRYMIKKGFTNEEIQTALLRLLEEKLLDDKRYARIMSRHQAVRGKGPAYIQAQLRQDGVKIPLSEARALYGETSDLPELEAARRIVERRYPEALEKGSDQKIRARAYQALVRRGFSSEIARLAIKKSA